MLGNFPCHCLKDETWHNTCSLDIFGVFKTLGMFKSEFSFKNVFLVTIQYFGLRGIKGMKEQYAIIHEQKYWFMFVFCVTYFDDE